MLLIKGLLLLICLSAIAYYCYSIYGAFYFFNLTNKIDSDFHPPVTILKPIAGLDWQIYDNLASFCQQDYPEYQVIFSLQDSADSSREIIELLINKFPHLDLSLVISDRPLGNNLKISNLAQAVNAAKHSILIISDSDIRVNPDYLKTVVQPLQDSQVGVVTCLYNSLTSGWLASFEALEISTQFSPRVLTARLVEGIKFAFGSTIVIRKSVLEEIGGFMSIVDYLADDYQLGNLPAKKGYQVILSNYIVEHILADVTIKDFIYRQSRWAKCIRVERFWSYLGLIFTQGTVASLLFLLVTGGASYAWYVLIITCGIRLLMAWIIAIKYLNDPVAKKYFSWILIRDIASFTIWCYSLFGNNVEWRGKKFKLLKGGKLLAINI